MTIHKNLKRRIRTRMAETGERYSTARMHVLGLAEPAAPIPNRPAAYELIGGGADPDVAALHNALLAAGVTSPVDGEPLSDAMLFGLGGGIGFLYAVFEYEGWDPMLSIGVRFTMLGHDLARTALERAGIPHAVLATGSEAKADRELDGALAAGRAPVVSLDFPSLPIAGLPDHYKTTSSDQAVVIGADDTTVWLDMGRLLTVDRSDYRTARAAYRKAKHQMLTITDPTVGNLEAGVREAIAATCRNFVESPFKGFAANWGLRGMDKWATLLTDDRDAKGWPRVFGTDPLAVLALWRVFESIEAAYTPGSAGRALYGEFLGEAGALLGDAAIAEIGDEFVELGSAWSGIARTAVSGAPVFDELMQAEEERARLLDDPAADAGSRRRDLFDAQTGLREAATLPEGFAERRFAELAERVRKVADRERALVERLAGRM